MNEFDLIIIGGGAAGMMASISAKRTNPKLNVAVLDRTFALGRKILVCGAGRCNITNINLDTSISQRYYGASKEFINAVFDQFGYKDIVSFFNDLGIELYVERKTNIGKLFPVTDQAKTVTALLEDEMQRLGIKVFLNTEVTNVENRNSEFLISALNIETKNQHEFKCQKLIISAGGKTYPALGSNGTGYSLAESFGHRIVEPVPSALPLVSKNQLSHLLQGIKLELEVTSIIDKQELKSSTDDVMFTQYGFSGPAILNISREISIHINRYHKNDAEIRLNFFPGKTLEQVFEFMQSRWNRRPNQTIEKSLYGLFPNKVPLAILTICKIDPNSTVATLSDANKRTLLEFLVNARFKITETKGWNEAEFTAGGIDTSGVKVGTLESNIVPNLYFCGEILDVDGDVGGFNLSWAWSSGNVAGRLL